MEYIEFSAKTVNDAIMKAMTELKVPSDRLDIQVVTEGSKGFLGIGNKPAVVKVKVKEEETQEKKVVPKENKEVKEVKEKAEKKESEKTDRTDKPQDKKNFERNKNYKKDFNKKNKKHQPNDRRDDKKYEAPEKKPEIRNKEEIVVKTEEEISVMKQSASKFLNEVFEAMGISTELTMNYIEKGGYLEINLSGEDNGVLIGKRGQTLDSLQYLTSLVVNKAQKEYVRVKLDTEDYRRRRKETLENLAKEYCEQGKENRKNSSS